ncbi:hypothetical protein [Anoxybacteroides tepidamans]|uniref:hypothetical protein n=1 Tax=Anoxybacteroides tepidamans TaxID=265948 RepID=UPI00048091FC|nr:hypothetical protein [Anoxybacillus tepidamans]
MPKFSPRSYWINGMVFLILFIMLVISRFMLGAPLTWKNINGFLLVSALLALATGVGPIARRTLYLTVVLSFYFFAIVDLLYISWMKANDGWSDLTSFFSFLTICLIGIAVGLVAQLLQWRMKK